MRAGREERRGGMEEELTPDEIRERYGGLPYITPYEKIVALTDEIGEHVELHEYHARGRCGGGAAWEVYHYARTSSLVINARREGARNIFTCRTGTAALELTPGVSGAGLEEVRIEGDQVAVTYAGLAGGGVAATLCRGMAENVLSTVVHQRGGGSGLGRATLRLPASRKLIVGVDDTDDAERGATWSTVNEIAFALEEERECVYLGHTIVQLFPDNPHKTTNCCSTAVVMGVDPGRAEAVGERFEEMLAERCYSDQCGMAVSGKVLIGEQLRGFTVAARHRMVTLEDAQGVAGRSGVDLREVTGPRGCIGALAAVGAHNAPDTAVIPFGGAMGGGAGAG